MRKEALGNSVDDLFGWLGCIELDSNQRSPGRSYMNVTLKSLPGFYLTYDTTKTFPKNSWLP